MNAVWWIRRDLRLSDNPALTAALKTSEQVFPVFILDPALIESPYMSEIRLAFLFEGLRRLARQLEDKGCRLFFFKGRPVDVFSYVLEATKSDLIYAEEDFSPYARRRDESIRMRFPLKLVGSSLVRHPASVLKSDGRPYTVYTPFSRVWKSLPLPEILPAPERLPKAVEIQCDPIPEYPLLSKDTEFLPGETEAFQRLSRFTSGLEAPIYRYEECRNFMDQDGTSKLSPYLHLGMISARQAVSAAEKAMNSAPDETSRRSAEIWLNELIWREFYGHILYHFPNVLKESFRPELRNIPWANQEEDFLAWCEGRTGVPIVDAGMRQLVQTGWMHNRARMIAASYLTKDLLIDWRWGERWFMQKLIDGDLASNNGGWQWTAGTGTDAAPYFRIFNPVSQGQRYDPHGYYVRRWVNELEGLPDEFIQAPWMMPMDDQVKNRCILGRDYPYPRVDHHWARERVLSAFRMAKEV